MKKEFTFTYHHYNSWSELSESQQKTVRAAEEASKNAYAPYSNFSVGAALLLENGELVLGSNQENKAFPSGLCAERVALFSYGASNKTTAIKSLAVVSDGNMLDPEDIFSPCGSCRQVMAEYSNRQEKAFEIILKGQDGSFQVFEGIHHLLPFIFGSK